MSHEQSAAESSTVMAQRRWSSFVRILPDYIVRPPNLRQRPLRDGLYLMGSGPTRVQPFFALLLQLCLTTKTSSALRCFSLNLELWLVSKTIQFRWPIRGRKPLPVPAYIYPLTSLRWRTSFFKTGQWISCNSFLTQHIINYCGGDVDPFII